jgi:hypothetical protein
MSLIGLRRKGDHSFCAPREGMPGRPPMLARRMKNLPG